MSPWEGKARPGRPEALSEKLERILPTVSRPARYTGGEWNAHPADWERVCLRFALAYPDLYEIGMANLGLMILYDRLNRMPGVLAERVYMPWVDMEAAMRRRGLVLYGLESRHPLADFDFLGFSLPYELTYTNVLTMLDLAGLPLLAEERGPQHPLVIAGGSGAYNPEPMAAFVDLFVVGEGEEALDDLVALFLEVRASGGSRETFLRRAASLPGVYVPRFYRVEYHPDGTISRILPEGDDIPRRIYKRVISDLSATPPVTRPVVPYVDSVHDRAVLEIQRGCGRGCRFCQAGMIYRPVRERPPEEVRAAARELLSHTGYEELALLSFSTSDYSRLPELLEGLQEDHAAAGLTISLPSLRLDAFSVELAERLSRRRHVGLTFAPEAGTQRLRDVINKGLTRENFTSTLEAAFSRGWQRVKLYFMIGLPTEDGSDLAGIVEMVQEALHLGRRHAGRRARLSVSVAPFVPKPHTPFQWAGQDPPEVLEEKLRFLRRSLRDPAVEFSWQDVSASRLEAALSRGDRRLSQVILAAWQEGARFDAWEEHFRPERWWEAFARTGLDPAFYAQRPRPRTEIFPWEHISCGVSRAFLWREYRRALSGEATPDCRSGPCAGCGIQRLIPCPSI